MIVSGKFFGVRRLVYCCVAMMLGCLSVTVTAAEEEQPINLLRMKTTTVDHSSAITGEASRLSALTDEKSGTVAQLTIASGAHLDIVYAFADETVAPEKVVIELSGKEAEKSAAPRVEILASTLSPHAGFQSIRTCMLKPKSGKQEFPFLAVGARWILLRITPAAGEKQVSLAEISVVGHKGQPVTHYAFAEAPAKAFSVLSQLKHLVKVRISNDEASLFADAQDGKLDEWTFAEAARLCFRS